jgi:hypothetical protein
VATFNGVKLSQDDITFVENALRTDRLKWVEGRSFDDPYYKYLLAIALRVDESLKAELRREG